MYLARRQGASLIIVLVLLVVIGLTSAASLRNASSNERVSHNVRMHWLAEQYAEAALRYCQSQLLLADAQRVSSLQEAALIPINATATPGWANPQTWSGSGGAFASLTSVLLAFVESLDSVFVPELLRKSVVERQALPLLQNGALVGSADVYVITARGFSPDYRESLPGARSGAVVWLQCRLSVQRAAPGDAGTLADRVWMRIINPPAI
jgi:Tfp pilus assembly protein PilX